MVARAGIHAGPAAHQEDRPGAFGRGVVAVLGRDLDDVAVGVARHRVGLVDLLLGALAVVGQHDIDAPVHRVGLDVLRPVHRRGLQEIGGDAGIDQHVGLAVEAVFRRQRPLAVDQRQPFGLAVVVEAGDVERAVVHQVLVGGTVVGVVRPRGDELVDIVEALVVAGVEHHAAVLGHRIGATLVLEAAERGALDRRRAGIVGIDLDHPAETVGLVGLLLDVEAVDVAWTRHRARPSATP